MVAAAGKRRPIGSEANPSTCAALVNDGDIKRECLDRDLERFLLVQLECNLLG